MISRRNTRGNDRVHNIVVLLSSLTLLTVASFQSPGYDAAITTRGDLSIFAVLRVQYESPDCGRQRTGRLGSGAKTRSRRRRGYAPGSNIAAARRDRMASQSR